MTQAAPLLIRNTRILDLHAKQPSDQRFDVWVVGNQIERITAAQAQLGTDGVDCIDASKHCLIPGLVNAHTHSPASYAKGTVDIDNHPRFMWRNQAETIGRSAQEIYNCTLLTGIELIKSGVTAVIDHYPEQPFSFDDVGPVVQAYCDLGLRACIALRVYDEPYYDILPAADRTVPAHIDDVIRSGPLTPRSASEQLALCEALIQAYDGAGAGLIKIMVAPSAPLRCSDGFLSGLVGLSERYGIGIHTHLLETPVAVQISHERFGKSLVQRMQDLGMLGSHVSCAHAIYVDDDDIKRLSQTGTVVVHNPVSNLRIGDGVAPVARMHHAGVPIAFGTDGASTNDNLSILEEIKLGTILQRVQHLPLDQWLSAQEALTMAIEGGAKAIGREGELGRITRGQLADFFLVNLNSIYFTPLNDIVKQLVYADLGRSIEHVIVNGQVVMRAGELTTVNTASVLGTSREQRAQTMARNQSLYAFANEVENYLD